MIKLSLKSLLKKRSFFIPLLLLLVMVGAIYFANLKNFRDTSIAGLIQPDLSLLKKQARAAPKNSEVAHTIRTRLALENGLVKNYNSGHWSKAAQAKLTINQADLAMSQSHSEPRDNQDFICALTSENIVLKYVIAHNTRPETASMPIQGFTFLSQVLDYYFPMIIIIVMIFMVASLSTQKFLGKRNTDRLLPQNLTWLDLQRCLACTAALVLAYTSICLFAWGLATIMNGPGDFNYPVVLELKTVGQTITTGRLLLKVAVLQLLAIVSITLLTQLIANLTHNANLTLLLTMVITLFQSLIPDTFAFLHAQAHLFPAIYFNAEGIVTRRIAFTTQNQNLTFRNGVITLLLYITILIVGIYLTNLWQNQLKTGRRNHHNEEKI